ncbi:type IV secretory system conjugative DNA transfer family protein [Pseudoflavonifractor phocaeensis]|uniref:type IV secretory system conjugative DNA transfer family protein n=1 Tax=Pseudoflavonifractor phocaeensis TaxID=1870988 RepID=UPI001FB028A8|nr:type IV secretory system conjugative DNA transfer family protein [Pseudoflavonifractor phocaeensis]
MSVKEVACFLLLPAGEEELPGIPGLHPKLLLPPKWYKEPTRITERRAFATTLDGEPKLLSIAPKDALEHTVLLGPTGSGKSTAMQTLILSDIRAGRSVLVLDPKADLVTELLERIPEDRKDDIVVIDPSDPAPVGFNPLMYNRDPSLTADAILAVFQELFAQNWGIRSADVLSGALLTLARIRDANLLWLPQLLTDENFRRKTTSQISDPIALNPFWSHFEAMRDTERRTEIAPVLNKLRQITYRPGLRNVLGQSEPKFSLTDLFYKRRIVLVPLNRGLIGAESARLLGSLIVGLTWTLALSRANVAPEKRHMVSIYIDELQDYLSLPTSFSDALAQARGLGVAYTVAHQYRGQLPPDVKAGIDANCRNKIIFGLNSDDAKDMAAQAPELEALDFMTLPRYHIYTALQSDGRNTGWISGRTLSPMPPLRMAAEIKAESMNRYGVPAEETESALIRMMTSTEPEPDPVVTSAPIGRRKKT